MPTRKEVALVAEAMSLQHNPPQQRKDNEKANFNNRYYDLFWALLNCNEFLLNH
jgi:hypothetical protein